MTDTFDYPRLLQRALRSVVREVLTVTAAEGLPGEHYFYLSVRTDRPDVRLPPFLRQRYPEEITVVLQNQFWDLSVDGDRFAVTLRFDGMPARLDVPFDAVTAFFDPAAQFGLRFDLAGLGGAAPVAAPGEVAAGADAPEGGRADAALGEAAPQGGEAPAEPGERDPGGAANGSEKPAAGEAKVLSFDRARDRREPENE
jgi:hypothetical protein